MPWPPLWCGGCAWRSSQSLEMLEDILVSVVPKGISRRLRVSVVDHVAYEPTNGFFALRALRPQPKLTQ